MKPCSTAATGTQKVVVPSSVDQPALATGPKLSMPGMSLTLVICFFLKSSSEASKGRQAMMSPAVPASSFEFSAALYSLGAVGLKVELDARMALLEGRDDLLLPDRQVVVAPALDGQRGVGGQRGRDRAGQDGRCRDAGQGPGSQSLVAHGVSSVAARRDACLQGG